MPIIQPGFNYTSKIRILKIGGVCLKISERNWLGSAGGIPPDPAASLILGSGEKCGRDSEPFRNLEILSALNYLFQLFRQFLHIHSNISIQIFHSDIKIISFNNGKNFFELLP